jgi:hypothetical protein
MKIAAFIVATALVASAVNATPLPANGSVSPIPVYGSTFTSWTSVSPGFMTSTFSAATFSGEIRSQVFTGSPDNPYGAGALTFVYILQNYAVSAHSLGRFTVNGYTGVSVDSGADPATATPAFVDAFESNRTGDGESVGWTFLDLPPGYTELAPGTSSRLFVLHTNATAYAVNNVSVIDGDIASALAYAPVPAPGAGALLALGAAAAFRRRR